MAKLFVRVTSGSKRSNPQRERHQAPILFKKQNILLVPLIASRVFLGKVGLPDETCNAYVAEASESCDAEAMCMNCMVQVGATEDGSSGGG